MPAMTHRYKHGVYALAYLMNRPALALSSGARLRRSCPLYVTAMCNSALSEFASRQIKKCHFFQKSCWRSLESVMRKGPAYLIRLSLHTLGAQQDTLITLTFRIHLCP